MRRVRSAAARQRAGLAAATLVLAAAVATPLALLPGLVTHSSGVKPSAVATARTPSPGSSASSVPSWAKGLHGEVAYKCGNYICLMRPDGTGKRTLTATYPEWDPAWSPDGRMLAFRGYYGTAKGDYAIYIVDADGCHLKRLAGGMGGISPSWSPTGRQIAFAVGGIDVMNVDDTGYRRLTRDTSRYGDDSPAWSARNRIAFIRTRIGTPSGEIYTMNADGTGIHRVSPPGWTSYSPTWTPGRKVAFLVQTASGTDAYIVNPDGTGLRRLYPSLVDGRESIQIAWGSAPLPRASC